MPLLCWFHHFLDSRAELCLIFCSFFGQWSFKKMFLRFIDLFRACLYHVSFLALWTMNNLIERKTKSGGYSIWAFIMYQVVYRLCGQGRRNWWVHWVKSSIVMTICRQTLGCEEFYCVAHAQPHFKNYFIRTCASHLNFWWSHPHPHSHFFLLYTLISYLDINFYYYQEKVLGLPSPFSWTGFC